MSHQIKLASKSKYFNALIEIFYNALSEKPHPNQPIVWMQIRDEWLQRGFTISEFESLIKNMVADGDLVEDNGGYMLTDLAVSKGYITPPSLDDIEERIMNEFKLNECRPSYKLSLSDIRATMINEGFINSDVEKGYKSLLYKNQLTQFDDYLVLTQIGFDALKI